MKCKEIIERLRELSPEHLACTWDNVGLLVGSQEKEINRIYVALDATDNVISEAVKQKADMLLTHHPMIFKGLKKVTESDFIGRRVIELIRHDMAYYAMHTNFDVAGMAELAAEKMQLQEASVLQKTTETENGPAGIGRVGNLPFPMSLDECIARIKEAFEIDTVKVFGFHQQPYGPKGQTTRIALCPGSGKSVIEDALQAGAQVLVTGDIDHHEGIDAVARGMAVIDAGHYGMEKMFIPYIFRYLNEALPELTVLTEIPQQPFVYI